MSEIHITDLDELLYQKSLGPRMLLEPRALKSTVQVRDVPKK